MEKNGYRKIETDRRIKELEAKMDTVFDHIATTNLEMGGVKTNVDWLVRFFWIIAVASISGLVAAVINLMVQLTKLTK